MKTNTQFHRSLIALAAKSAALVLALASANLASAQTNNTRTGANALADITTGDLNTADGAYALLHTTTGRLNTAVGANSLKFNTAGNQNTAVGYAALQFNTASGNTALGWGALDFNTSGTLNTASGSLVLLNNTTGSSNTATGYQALTLNTTGASNVANGYQALQNNTNGGFNVAIGDGALLNNTTGSGNIGIGEDGGFNLTAGDNNICIGNKGVAGQSGIIRIGTSPTHTATYLAGVIHGNGAGLTGLPAASLTGTITSAQIDTSAVTNAKIANGAVGSGKLAANLTLGGTTVFSGNVGIGTTTPGVSLDVAGNINSSGKPVPVAEEISLRIVRGTLHRDAGGNYFTKGSGWTWAHPSKGNFTITFDVPFSDLPAVTFGVNTFNEGGYGFITTWDATESGFNVQTRGGNAVLGDFGFDFIAIGPR